MKVFVLTGSIASGKTTIANIFRDFGIKVFSSDHAVHELYKEPEIIAKMSEIVPDIIEEGQIDRYYLAVQLYQSDFLRTEVENYIHPLVRQKQLAFLREQSKAGAKLVILDIPLFFEKTQSRKIGEFTIDKIISVITTYELQIARALARPNMNMTKLQKIISLQVAQSEKEALSDYVIYNYASLDSAKDQVRRLLKSEGLANAK